MLYQGIENEYVDQLGNSIYNQKKENFKYGTFKFSDGREISYKALWNMRTRVREANLFLNAKNRLKEKINQFGGESEYDDYLSSNSWQFFNKDDRRLYELDKFIETREERYGLVKDPDFGSKDDAIREREPLITKLGYKPLLGEDGEFVKDKYGKPDFDQPYTFSGAGVVRDAKTGRVISEWGQGSKDIPVGEGQVFIKGGVRLVPVADHQMIDAVDSGSEVLVNIRKC